MKKCSCSKIKEDVATLKFLRNSEDLAEYSILHKDLYNEWKELYKGRDFIKELLEKDSKLASYVSINAPEKIQKKISFYKKNKPQFIPEDVRELMK